MLHPGHAGRTRHQMSDIYESTKVLSEYLLFHYGSAGEILPPDRDWPAGMREALDFPVRTVGHFSKHPVDRGLDLGCAVGRSAFEMARSCREVVGIDFSNAFISAAESMRTGAKIPYDRCEEASLSTRLEATLPNGIEPDGLIFEQGDAMNLRDDLGVFDRVHAANLLCRLTEPERLLGRLPSLVGSGGELVLATPCTWLEEFTPRANWPLGGTFEWLKSRLAPDFELLAQADEPFLIRETARKFQWTASWVTVWRRKS
jgi:putative 4-mercaptohistidine N1-methyltranferase